MYFTLHSNILNFVTHMCTCIYIYIISMYMIVLLIIKRNMYTEYFHKLDENWYNLFSFLQLPLIGVNDFFLIQ